jgi:5-methylcytosine-specific restriction endonuclease McrA
MNIVTEKTCPKCKTVKTTLDFYKDKRTKSGLCAWCKDCKKNAINKWHAENPKRHYQTCKKWYVENKDRAVLRQIAYVAKNKEIVKKKKHDLYLKNRDKQRQAALEWNKKNPDKVKENLRNFFSKNPDKFKEYSGKRRSRIVGNGGIITSAEIKELFEKYGNRCLCCGSTEKKLTLDHVVPLKLGGKNVIENAQPLCGSCNSKKSARAIDYRM